MRTSKPTKTQRNICDGGQPDSPTKMKKWFELSTQGLCNLKKICESNKPIYFEPYRSEEREAEARAMRSEAENDSQAMSERQHHLLEKTKKHGRPYEDNQTRRVSNSATVAIRNPVQKSRIGLISARRVCATRRRSVRPIIPYFLFRAMSKRSA